MKQAHIFISGFVQGVGFRHFIKENAKRLGVKGWVKNLPDKRIEGVLQGLEENVNTLIEVCKKGPFLAEIEEVITNWEEANELYEEFTVLTS